MGAGDSGIAAAAVRAVELAARGGYRIAVAESLTGGLLASTLVSVPGASRVFSGGIVAYDTALKHSLLGVDAALLEETGPVDEEVARQMAAGVRRACAVGERPGADDSHPADLGVATTGVAGPDPDPQTGLPRGTVWIAVSSRRGERAIRLDLAASGGRAEIRRDAVSEALRLLIDELESAAQRVGIG